MVKADLVEKIQTATGVTRKDSIAMVESVLDIIKESLQSARPVKISGFGTFEVKHKAARTGRNPKTGEHTIISARRTLVFKTSDVLRRALNGTKQ